MAKKLKCDECGDEFSVSTKSHEPVTYCVFCGEELGIPFEDEDDEEDDDEE